MGIIRDNIESAFAQFQKDGNLCKLVLKIANDVDYSVRYAWQMADANDAIKSVIPSGGFECLFYDGENGEYHLLDFDPNGLSDADLLDKVKSALKYQVGIELDYIEYAMESIYLVPSYAMIKIRDDADADD